MAHPTPDPRPRTDTPAQLPAEPAAPVVDTTAGKPVRKARRKRALDRPRKPYDGYPLTAHPGGTWCKKIRGRLCYFGHWARKVDGKLVRVEGDGWKEALDLYNVQRDDLHAGRTPRVNAEGLTIAMLCDRFIVAKRHQRDAGELTARTWEEYKATTDRLVATFGKMRLVDDLAADDFEALRADLAKANGPVRLANEIQRVRTVFKYGFEAGLMATPVRFGPTFKKPSKSVMRRHRAQAGPRTFTADELRSLIKAAGVPLKAMILLGINAGFGNADCGRLPVSALDLDGGWVTFPRPKTGVPRRAKLWPETVAAIREALAARPEPKEPADAGLVFITKYGHPWAVGSTSDAVTLETGKLVRELGLHRKGLGFYGLRHSFRTIADATRDFPAVRLVMGHADESIDAVYRENIEDARLVAVADHVRAWLFPKPAGGGKKAPAKCKASEAPEATGERDQPGQAGSGPALRLYVG